MLFFVTVALYAVVLFLILLFDVRKIKRRRTQWDPIEDEYKLLTQTQFAAVAQSMLDDYTRTFRDMNEWRRETHTLDMWMSSFNRWRSW